MSGTILCLGLRFISGSRLRCGSTGETAILARLLGDICGDLGARVWGLDAALLDARRRLDDVLLCSMVVYLSKFIFCNKKKTNISTHIEKLNREKFV